MRDVTDIDIACPNGHRIGVQAAVGERVDETCTQCSVRMQALCLVRAEQVRRRPISELGRRSTLWTAVFSGTTRQQPTKLNFTSRDEFDLTDGATYTIVWAWTRDRGLTLAEAVSHDLPDAPSHQINLEGRFRTRGDWAYRQEGKATLPAAVSSRLKAVAAPAITVARFIGATVALLMQAVVKAWPLLMLIAFIWLLVVGLGHVIGPVSDPQPTTAPQASSRAEH